MWKVGAALLAVLVFVGWIVGDKNGEGRGGSAEPVPSSTTEDIVSSMADGDFSDEDGWCAVLRLLDGYTRTFPVKRGEQVVVDSGVEILAGLNAAGLAGSGRQEVCRAAVESWKDDHQPWVMLID